ncbi:rab-GTPase-TBC domain-containing protein [Ephemerocybe angulata]|uniref:Rab-GTPase-TBC domain-containing protein n=1 Tax=Ephemerocybe angulata TaxID=980116 RepID=A0A8H6IJ64_9AGAR|nr:rab-GTPase-TBC domain-containing protein [Tulosesus angulatus]
MSKSPVHSPTHAIAALSLNNDDAFGDDDDEDLSPAFTREAIRQELERHLPPALEPTWDDDADSEHNTASSTGAFFSAAGVTISPSVNGGAYGQEGEWTSPTLQSPPSGHFSRLNTSTRTEVHSDSDISPIRPGFKSLPASARKLEEERDHPYPSVIIDAPSHRVTLTSEFKPRTSDEARSSTSSPPHTEASSSASAIPAIAAAGAGVVAAVSSASAPIIAAQPQIPTSPSSSSSLPNTTSKNLLTEKPYNHKYNRSSGGPSAFEKVRSKTRPVFLPPKPRQEDDKHMADWQHMMKQSRVAAEKRRKALQDRRLVREKAIEESLHIWEREIVPDWKVVFKNPQLRKLWWRGIPTKLRASMWEKAAGNPLALSKDHFRICSSRAKRALASGVFPQDILGLIEEDVRTTLPGLHIFHHETGPLYSDLKDILYAWVVARSDEGLGYILGAARVAAMMLINLPIQNAFNVMRNLLDRHCLRSFYGGEQAKDDVEAYYRIFDTLLADGMPKIYFNFKQHQISPSAYLLDWLIPLFLNHLPFEACARVWDVLILEGDSFLFRAAIGILAVLEPRLFFPDRRELLELLQGENKPALEVAKRDGISLDGGKYEIYGVDEETLWDRIDQMEDWWKESTWTRLIQRELPDL